MDIINKLKQRNIFIDVAKGIAIITVAIYHFGGGVLPYGYLGVDIFLVVGGFLLFQSLVKNIQKGSFNYWEFLVQKLLRLWPLVLLAVVASLVLGYLLMLPDDYENLSESAVASSFFLNNILQCITTKNYWNVVNMYKPLMHLWYVGVLFQFYVVIPLIVLLVAKISKKSDRGILVGTLIITIVSFALYLMPMFTTAWKFYYFPFRLFEITAGGLISFAPKFENNRKDSLAILGGIISLFILVGLLCARKEFISASAMLILTVLGTLVFLFWTSEISVQDTVVEKLLNPLAKIGKSSYSIYIWHQLVVAFLFYSVFQHHGIMSFATFALLTAFFSYISYMIFESRLERAIHKTKKVRTTLLISCVLCSCVCSFFGYDIYSSAGVVRDIPELGVYKDNAHRNMHAEYCDRPYSWSKSFLDDGQYHILVIGNSFGRDWANILYEWNGTLDISYAYYQKNNLARYTDRIETADVVFYAMGPDYEDVPTEIIDLIPAERLYIIGNKSYGESNGIIYAKRKREDYFRQAIKIPDELRLQNERQRTKFGSHYIDMIGVAMVSNDEIRVFTEENMFISQDCKHLTHAGAIFYAERLDIGSILAVD